MYKKCIEPANIKFILSKTNEGKITKNQLLKYVYTLYYHTSIQLNIINPQW